MCAVKNLLNFCCGLYKGTTFCTSNYVKYISIALLMWRFLATYITLFSKHITAVRDVYCAAVRQNRHNMHFTSNKSLIIVRRDVDTPT